ncbi:hypothetical protein GBF38_015676 [Nibea albiflora]|uniref:Uncharacterized protein n=1 Tax=Nibea albiflora TaxID=240163 RepID=A0ACB7ELE8_NIBAL|nr:hypothetical protein GBF38_015676 [Nibea albiflora]
MTASTLKPIFIDGNQFNQSGVGRDAAAPSDNSCTVTSESNEFSEDVPSKRYVKMLHGFQVSSFLPPAELQPAGNLHPSTCCIAAPLRDETHFRVRADGADGAHF